jgi:2-polyprenyl-3-methyl-5-hydroxy-6-metoxy-1,4-benzoquinol methylase
MCFPPGKKLHVLEIGCAEAGVLKAFTELGHTCVGIELSDARTKLARQYLHKELESGYIQFLNEDIHDINPTEKFDRLFDVVILKDVIEHIHDQEKFIQELKKFLTPDGLVFFGFPPWYMPFGGHQQLASNKWLSKIPYYHILPKFLYKSILKMGKERDIQVENLLEIKQTGISIERFRKIVLKNGWEIEKQKSWLFNPIYQWKFGLKPRTVYPIFSSIPGLRNLYTTAAYFVIKQKR